MQEVEYVSLDGLRDFRSYTLLSSGERNVDVLPIEVYTKEAWAALTLFLLPSEAKDFSPGQKAKIALKRFRMEAEEVPTPEKLLETLAVLREAEAEVKLLSAMQDKGAASPFTAEQVEALKALHLTPACFFSPPTTTHYADRDEAVRSGEIDSFTRYKINFGTPTFLSGGEFRSGNAFLDRRYAVTLNGAAVAKPKLDTYLQGAKYAVKPPNPKAKSVDTPADVVMAKVADRMLLTDERMTNEQITERWPKPRRRSTPGTTCSKVSSWRSVVPVCFRPNWRRRRLGMMRMRLSKPSG